MRIAFTAIAAVAILAGQVAHAQNPAVVALLKRSMAHYDSAKSFQGLMQITKKQGASDLVISMDIKAENDAKGSILRSTFAVGREITGPAGRQKQDQLMVDDGKSVFVVEPANKRYSVQPHRADHLSKVFQLAITNAGKEGGDLAIGERKVEGRTCYALTGTRAGSNVLILIDKASLDLKVLTMQSSGTVTKLTLTRQAFNQPIPAATFAYSPPKDFQRMAVGPQHP